jgi:hypothetical protein
MNSRLGELYVNSRKSARAAGRLAPFVCLSLPMYEFWHEGFGKHIFFAVATACAIIFVQVCLVYRDRRIPQTVASIP